MKIPKKIWGGGGRGGQWEGSGWGGGGQDGCERRIEVFVKIQKKKFGGGGGVRWGGVNAMLGVGVMWGMGDVNQE